MINQKETFFFFRKMQCHFCQNLSLSKHGVHCPGGNTTLMSKIKIEYKWSGDPSNDDFCHDWLYAPGDWWLMFVPCICWLMIVPKDCWFWGWIEPGYWGLVDARLVYPKLGQLSLTLEPEKKVKLWNRFHCTFTCLQKCICDWKCKTYSCWDLHL